MSYFGFVSYTLKNEIDTESSTFPTIRIPFFGKLFVHDFVRERMIKKQSENIRAKK